MLQSAGRPLRSWATALLGNSDCRIDRPPPHLLRVSPSRQPILLTLLFRDHLWLLCVAHAAEPDCRHSPTPPPPALPRALRHHLQLLCGAQAAECHHQHPGQRALLGRFVVGWGLMVWMFSVLAARAGSGCDACSLASPYPPTNTLPPAPLPISPPPPNPNPNPIPNPTGLLCIRLQGARGDAVSLL